MKADCTLPSVAYSRELVIWWRIIFDFRPYTDLLLMPFNDYLRTYHPWFSCYPFYSILVDYFRNFGT
jgi:hypothetical protein